MSDQLGIENEVCNTDTKCLNDMSYGFLYLLFSRFYKGRVAASNESFCNATVLMIQLVKHLLSSLHKQNFSFSQLLMSSYQLSISQRLANLNTFHKALGNCGF